VSIALAAATVGAQLARLTVGCRAATLRAIAQSQDYALQLSAAGVRRTRESRRLVGTSVRRTRSRALSRIVQQRFHGGNYCTTTARSRFSGGKGSRGSKGQGHRLQRVEMLEPRSHE
jgi:hypothetical protein